MNEVIYGFPGYPSHTVPPPIFSGSEIVTELARPGYMLQKGWSAPLEFEPTRGPKSVSVDPFAMQNVAYWRERRNAVSFDVTKLMLQRVPLVYAAIQRRINQITSFAQPWRCTKQIGYIIRRRDPDKQVTRGVREMVRGLEAFVWNCGGAKENPHTKRKRPKFEQFLRAITHDTLAFDAVAVEKIPARSRRAGIAEFRAVDGSTIRFVDDEVPSFGVRRENPYQTVAPESALRTMWWGDSPSGGPYGVPFQRDARFVQIINGQPVAEFTDRELSYFVRNPRTDVHSAGYGYSEVERVITKITSILFADDYNTRQFTNGAMPKGMLINQDDALDASQVEVVRRQMFAQIVGAENSWRTIVVPFRAQWIDLAKNQRDAEFMQYIEYLVRVICACLQMDPEEIYMVAQRGTQQPLFEPPQEQRLKSSKDSGLRPLLRSMAAIMNEIIEEIDPDFMFEWAGLDEMTEQQLHTMRREQVQSYMTLNEVREAKGLPPIPGGDVILNQTFLAALQMMQQMAQQGGADGEMPAGNVIPLFGMPPGAGEDELSETPRAVFGAEDLQRAIAMARQPARSGQSFRGVVPASYGQSDGRAVSGAPILRR